MDNQHRKISGYRELTQQEIDLMNRIKALGPEIAGVLGDVREHLRKQSDAAEVLTDNPETNTNGLAERDRLNAAQPFRWANEAAIELQKGLMCLTRSVAQPTFF